MHSNYLNTFARKAHSALPQGLILSNRPVAPACAQRDERDFGGLS